MVQRADWTQLKRGFVCLKTDTARDRQKTYAQIF